MVLLKNSNGMHAEDVVIDATWQRDDNVFCFNLY
jgi:hypothetical protein